MKSFERIKALICEHPESIDVGIGASPGLLYRAEDYLGIKFPKSLKLYAATWGNLAIGPFVFYGVVESNFKDSKVPDGVWFTAKKRDVLGLPSNLFVIFNNEGDEFHCVDLETEKVVSWDTAQREIVAIKAENIFDYILNESGEYI